MSITVQSITEAAQRDYNKKLEEVTKRGEIELSHIFGFPVLPVPIKLLEYNKALVRVDDYYFIVDLYKTMTETYVDVYLADSGGKELKRLETPLDLILYEETSHLEY